MKALYVSALTVVLLLPCISHAGYWTGNDLKNWSDAAIRADDGRASSVDFQSTAMLQGFVGGVSSAVDGIAFCIPNGVTIGQLDAILRKYLLKNPEHWNNDAASIVVLAIGLTFQCKKN